MDTKTDRAALPILVFDERKLMPSFGYVFNRNWLDPYESIVSILWKFARMNSVPGHVLAAQLAKTIIDPYEGIQATRSAVDIRRLHHMLGLQLNLVRRALIPDSLHKISSPYFRFCQQCMGRGYHGVVHQLESVHNCPIHGQWLRVECQSCGEPSPYRLKAQLLDAPFRCGNCRASYAVHSASFLHRRPLTLRERVAITRVQLHYYSS